jgi:hypothetical protein
MNYRVAWANQGCWLFHYEIHYPVTRCQHCSSCHAQHLDCSYYLWKYQTRVSELGRRNTPGLIVCLRNFIAGPTLHRLCPKTKYWSMQMSPDYALGKWHWGHHVIYQAGNGRKLKVPLCDSSFSNYHWHTHFLYCLQELPCSTVCFDD